ncbi:MAG: hypothetical protein K9I85_11835 [Saprospiraceae bacterium]|nr:hypothetical protein [Saprospiraceae bacterium]
MSMIVLAFLLFLVQSCQEEGAAPDRKQEAPAGTPAEVWLHQDTLVLQHIDSLVGVTKARVYQDHTARTETLYFEDAPVDSANVSFFNGEMVHVGYRYFDPAREIWNDCFLKDGKMYFMRHREWNKRPEAHSAREIFFYFDDQESLQYARERYKVLGPQNIPADLLWEPMVDYPRTLEDAMTYVNHFWPKMRAHIQQKVKETGK